MQRGPIDLQRADVKVMRLGLRHPRAAICPGEPVELDIALDVETDDGASLRLLPRRRELTDVIFDSDQLYIESAQGRVVDGTFFPNPDARVSLGTGFTMFVRPPRGPSVSVRFPPYYECGGAIGGRGNEGLPGGDAADANPLSTIPRRMEGFLGAPRLGDINGAPGGEGPRFTVYVTWVKTADYTKLLAGRAVGDVDMVSFAAPGTPLNVIALGGPGGDGGRGARGETGGGSGGAAGEGGRGGVGGHVEVVLDERFTDLEQYVTVDVSGGPGGRPGSVGPGGDPWLVETKSRKGVATGRYVWSGERGRAGAMAIGGPRGDAGTFRIRKGEVRSKITGLGAVVPL